MSLPDAAYYIGAFFSQISRFWSASSPILGLDMAGLWLMFLSVALIASFLGLLFGYFGDVFSKSLKSIDFKRYERKGLQK